MCVHRNEYDPKRAAITPITSRFGAISQTAHGRPRLAGVDDGLRAVENRNGASGALFYGRDGDLTGSDREHQEVVTLALHLLR